MRAASDRGYTVFLLKVSTTPYSDFNVGTPPCHGVAMMVDSNLKYVCVSYPRQYYNIYGSTYMYIWYYACTCGTMHACTYM